MLAAFSRRKNAKIVAGSVLFDEEKMAQQTPCLNNTRYAARAWWISMAG
jgi:hypothetical protein